jgi:hypothetical protein
MNSRWEQCPRGDVVGRWAALYVTLNNRGYIVFNRKTHELLGCSEAVQIFFDRTNSQIGLKPTPVSARHAFPVAKYGRHGGKLIRAHRMLREYDVIVKDTIRFHDAEIGPEGLLVLDLRTAKTISKEKR